MLSEEDLKKIWNAPRTFEESGPKFPMAMRVAKAHEEATRKEIGKKLYQIRRDAKDPMEYSNAIVDLRDSLSKGELPNK